MSWLLGDGQLEMNARGNDSERSMFRPSRAMDMHLRHVMLSSYTTLGGLDTSFLGYTKPLHPHCVTKVSFLGRRTRDSASISPVM